MTILTATYRDANHNNPNVKGNERIMTISREAEGVRILIVGCPFMTNDPMVVVSDATIPESFWAQYEQTVMDGLAKLEAKVTR